MLLMSSSSWDRLIGISSFSALQPGDMSCRMVSSDFDIFTNKCPPLHYTLGVLPLKVFKRLLSGEQVTVNISNY